MKILIMLGHNRMTGVNTLAYTLAKELNHHVDVEIQDFGQRILHYDENDTKFIDLIKPHVDNLFIRHSARYDSYDIIILNYNVHEYLVELSSAKKIFVIHGTSWPSSLYYEPSTDDCATVAVSGRIKEKQNTDYIIYNGIDLSTFKPEYNSKPKPSKAFRLSRHPIKPELQTALDKLNINVIGDALIGKSQSRVIDLIHKSDFVIAYGRGAYEAMACGKPVFVSGTNGTDGWVTKENFLAMRYSNMAGYFRNRNGESFLSSDEITSELKKYTKKMEKVNRTLAERYLSSVTMAQEYDQLMRRLYEGRVERHSGNKQGISSQ